MVERRDRSSIPNGARNDFDPKEPAKPRTESELVNLFEESGLFETYTPPGIHPTVFPMDVLGHLKSDVGMKAYRISRSNRRAANQLESWEKSIDKVNMALEITVYPILEQAEHTFAKDPEKGPPFGHPAHGGNAHQRRHPGRSGIPRPKPGRVSA